MVRRAGALPAGERLRHAGEIQSVFENASRMERRTFVALWRPGQPRRRAGFAVSRQVRRAVDRNRVRRRLREAYRHRKAEFPSDLSLVFIGRPQALTSAFAEIDGDMAAASRLLTRRTAGPAGESQGG
jgi:ribonuclease P protein component